MCRGSSKRRLRQFTITSVESNYFTMENMKGETDYDNNMFHALLMNAVDR